MNATAHQKKLAELQITDIKTNGVASIRQFYRPEKLESLKQSVVEEGVLQPVVVSQEEDGSYELVIGSRRIKSSQRAGEKSIPAVIVKGLDDKSKLIMALSENIHREDLTPFEEARVMLRLLNEYKMSIKGLSTVIGLSERSISSRIRLLKLPTEVQEMISEQLLGINNVSIIEQLKSPEDQARFARITVDHHLNVQELLALIRNEVKKEKKKKEPKRPMTAERANLRISVATNSIKTMGANIVGANKKDLLKIRLALVKLEMEVKKWIEKIDAETK